MGFITINVLFIRFVIDLFFLVISDTPNIDEIKANINKSSDEVIAAEIMFEKVYPPPECILVANVCI